MTRLKSRAYRFVQLIYNAVLRPYLPKTWGIYAGVPAPDRPLLDLTICQPSYKKGLIDAIHEHATDSSVGIVAFGRGVTTVHAVRAGATNVHAYEAATRMIELGQRTLDCVLRPAERDRITVERALVGEAVDVYGDYSTAAMVSPNRLTEFDVLVLDCEGAEVSILSDMHRLPSVVICETHPTKGAPTRAIHDLLSSRDFDATIVDYHPDDQGDKRVVIGSSES